MGSTDQGEAKELLNDFPAREDTETMVQTREGFMDKQVVQMICRIKSCEAYNAVDKDISIRAGLTALDNSVAANSGLSHSKIT